MKHKIQNIHFVGIGGVGMSGIAEVLLGLGYRVSGSDTTENSSVQRLIRLGAQISLGHAEANVQDADVVVISTAIAAENPEVVAARTRHIPVIPRALMLAELMRFKQGIAVAGTHGKTTTTSLVASVLAEGGLDPTFVIGGQLVAADANARLGAGEFLVAEADESDATFLHLTPTWAIVTNIDADHMATYEHNWERLQQAFVDFIHRLPFYGSVAVCLDDPAIQAILPRLLRPTLTYGFHPEAQFRATDVVADGLQMHFTVHRSSEVGRSPLPPLPITLNLAGRHNVQNALAAIAIASELDVPDAAVAKALREFHGVGRRFQQYGDIPLPVGGCCTLIDDYGHHPVEMQATLAAARGAFPNRRICLVFQPHRFSRTRDLFEDFVRVLATVDVLVLTEVYPAGEAPIIAADSRALARAVRVAGARASGGGLEPVFVPDLVDVPTTVLNLVQDGDLVLTMGAGSIGKIPAALVAAAECRKDQGASC